MSHIRTRQADIVPPALLSYETAGLYLGDLSRSTLKVLVARGHLRRVKLGGRTLFRRDELDRYIASLNSEP